MLKSYFNIALRSLRKHPAYALINVAGLAIGLACFALILLFVRDEFSYDRFHENADRIYRVTVETEASEGRQHTAQAPPIAATQMRAQFPEIEAVARLKPPRQSWMVRYEDRRFTETGWMFADSSVFDVFDFRLTRGAKATALNVPWTVAISESMAEKYFEGRDPLGETMRLDNQYDFVVTGVFADVPRNSHVHPDFLASFVSMEDPTQLYLFNALEGAFPFSYNYVLLREGTSARALEAKFPEFVKRTVPPQFLQTNAVRLHLQPLADIHLLSHLENEIEANGDADTVYVFLAIAVFLLLIACVNFMNLATARGASRAKEVGMRKVVGAHRGQLVGQFLGESVVLAMIGLGIALLGVLVALGPFNTITGKGLDAAAVFAPGFLALLVVAALATGLLAGSYPALFLSSFEPAAVLKGEKRRGSGSSLLRKGLIVFQFCISIGLIISTLIVYEQVRFAQNKKLGLDKEHVLVVELTDPVPTSRYRTWKPIVEREPGVVSVSASMSRPAGLVQQWQIRPATASTDQMWQVQSFPVDYDFLETMGMELAAGRTFRRESPSDTTSALLINETAARSFGWHNPADAVGRELQFPGATATLEVIGVVKDFHSQSVREQIAPAIIIYNTFRFFAFVRIASDDIPATLAMLEQHWNRVVPGYAFLYSFLDADFDRLYKTEDVLGTLLLFFAGLTIFIACLGLFGLAAFTTEQRTKEIGIRKALGATVPELVFLLSKEVTILVLIGFAVAVPLAYVGMDRWLGAFAYHIALGPWVFVGAGLGALAIAWVTVSYQSIKTARVNPVKALRYE